MATAETVRGPVDVGELGPTLMHVLSTEHVPNYGEGLWWEEDARVADAVGQLRALRMLAGRPCRYFGGSTS